MKIEDVSELELYINQLKQQTGKPYTNWSELIKDLKYEFNINTTLEQINEVYSPSLEESVLDLELMYKNIFE